MKIPWLEFCWFHQAREERDEKEWRRLIVVDFVLRRIHFAFVSRIELKAGHPVDARWPVEFQASDVPHVEIEPPAS